MDTERMRSNARAATTLLKAMANEHRLWILCQLHEGALTVSTLNERISLSQSALSQHLAKLREDQLVSTRKDGLQVYYSLRSDAVKDVIEVLHRNFCTS